MRISLAIALILHLNLSSFAQVFSDEALNYNNSWVNGSNKGSGFEPWQLTSVGSTGLFIGNPANDGMQTQDIGTTAFGMFATSTTNYASAYRRFAQPLAVGDVFSFFWVMNWDAKTGNKGFDIRSGNTTVFNVNNGNNDDINSTGGPVSTAYGTKPMKVSVIRMNDTQYLFKIIRRIEDGGDYTTVFSSTNEINGIYFYIGAQGDNDKERNIYFNKLEIIKSAYTLPVPNFVLYKWSGALTPTSIKVNAKLALATPLARLVVSTDKGFTNPLFSLPVAISSSTNFVGSFSLDSLMPDTEYFYRIESNGTIDTSAGATGRFKTAQSGSHSFQFTAGACNLNSRNPVWRRIYEKDPLFMLVMGDLHYSDPNSTDVNIHRLPYENRVLSIDPSRDLFNNYPIAYIWDDHDFSGDNSNASSTGANSAKQAYREYVPHYPFGSGLTGVNSPIYQSFTIGRVRFILTDLRSEVTANQVMSPQQVTWFKNQCLEAKAAKQIICWVSSFGITANNPDAWGGTPMAMAQRNELFNFLTANSIENLFILSGDAHAAGIDDGTNTDCSGVFDTNNCPRFSCSLNPRYPLLHAAGLSNTVSLKGIKTDILPMTGLANNGQYAKVDVEDNGGASVKISFTVYRVNPDTRAETILGTYSFNRTLDSIPEQKSLISTGDTWKFLDNGSDQGANWRTENYADDNWKDGASPLGYVSTGVRTPVSFGPNTSAKYITTYFRKKISITNTCRIKAAYIELSVDDGAVLYLNNIEIGRANFNNTTYNYLTPATAVATNVPQTFRFCINDPSIFKYGENILAVEVHQHSGTSSDLFFNLHLSVLEKDTVLRSDTTAVACNFFEWNGQTYTQSGIYDFNTQSSEGCDSTVTLNLTINRVQITQQPTDTSSVLNGEAVFSVSSLEPNVTYQWQSDSGEGFENLSDSGQFSGVQSPNLRVSGVTISNNNQRFRCIVSANGCSSVSDSAVLKVDIPIVATITALNCEDAVNKGTLTAGTAAADVNSIVPYSGGNGETYEAQSVASTGVTGLTATLAADTLENGDGNLTYIITGTPDSSGTASFALTIGGQSCTLTRTVDAAVDTTIIAAINTLNCADAINNGTLTAGTAATDVNSIVPYSGGNGEVYEAQSVASTGVTGLTATLAADTLENGDGNLTYIITGTPDSSGTASFALTIGGQSCSLEMEVDEVVPTSISGTLNDARDFSMMVYPNPVSGASTLRYHLPRSGRVHLQMMNIQGQILISRNMGYQHTGLQLIQLNTDDFQINKLTSGTYLLQMRFDDEVRTQKIVIQH